MQKIKKYFIQKTINNMKKIILSLFVCVLASQTYAQKFRFGLTATPLMIDWLKSNTDSLTSGGIKLGFTYGLNAEYMLTDRYSLATGLHVMYRGGILEQQFNDTTYKATIKSNITAQYVELPVTLKMKTKAIGMFTYFGQFGLGLGYNIKGKNVTEINDVKIDEDKDFNKELIGMHVALHIGLGAEYHISEATDIVGTIYWNNGFTDILKDKDYKAVTNNIGLSIGVLF